MNDQVDTIYQQPQTKRGKFQFDQRVAEVFADMIARSVPGYEQILGMLPTLVRQFRQENASYYDLGCSLGAGTLAMAEGLDMPSKLIGIDNSEAMLNSAEPILKSLANHSVELRCEDICDTEISHAALVLMNFTLQFVPLDQRDELIRRCYRGLLDGGALVLSEKLSFENAGSEQHLTDIHHQYKADQGYSQLEIAQKRDAIEDVLVPETLSAHTERLRLAGFQVITPWIQNLQFVSILAVK